MKTISGFEVIKRGRIHPAGWPFIGGSAFLTFLLSMLSHEFLLLGGAVTLWCAYFFRDPVRVPPPANDAVVAPADGLVVAIVPGEPPQELGESGGNAWTRVSIFLNIFDVHVNRIPYAGRILKTAYHPGKFLNASLDKASELNERNSLVLETPQGIRLIVVQVAGLIARRIMCDVTLGDEVSRGQRYGIIRFGSRVDLYLSSHTKIMVAVGQRMVGGETVIASLSTDNAL